MLVELSICVIVNLYYYSFSLEYIFIIYNMIIVQLLNLLFFIFIIYITMIFYII